MKSAVNWLLPIIIVVVASIGVTATIIHNKIQKENSALKEHKLTFKRLLDYRDSKLEYNVFQLGKGTIAIPEFILERKKILQEYSLKHKEYVSIKKELIKKQAFLGYTSYKNFLLSTGIRFFALVISMFYFSSKIKQSYSSKSQQIFYLTISSAFVLTATYWLTWSLIYKVNSIGKYDFEQWHQDVLIITTPIILLFSSYFLFKHYTNIEEKLTKVIHSMSRFMIKDAKKHIKPESIIDYKKEYINALKDGMS